MTQKKDNAKQTDWKEIFSNGSDGLRALVQEVVQEVLEAEMDETVGAHKSEQRAIVWGTGRDITRGRW
jgi:transposase-like protein